MDEDTMVAAVLTAGVLMRMPGTGAMWGEPERDRAARAAEAIETYCAVLKALRVAAKAGLVDDKAR